MDTAEALFKAGNGSAAMEMVVHELDQVRRSMSAAAWKTVARWVAAHPVGRFLYEDPLTRRAFAKPRGYAGDAVMMDYIYGIGLPDIPPTGEPVTMYISQLGHASRAPPAPRRNH
jgi:hypothetical protein